MGKEQRMRWLHGIPWLDMDMSLSKLWEMLKDREAKRAAVHGVTKSQMQLRVWSTTTNTYWEPAMDDELMQHWGLNDKQIQKKKILHLKELVF